MWPQHMALGTHGQLTDAGIQAETHLHFLPDPSVSPSVPPALSAPTHLETYSNQTTLGHSSQAARFPRSLTWRQRCCLLRGEPAHCTWRTLWFLGPTHTCSYYSRNFQPTAANRSGAHNPRIPSQLSSPIPLNHPSLLPQEFFLRRK